MSATLRPDTQPGQQTVNPGARQQSASLQNRTFLGLKSAQKHSAESSPWGGYSMRALLATARDIRLICTTMKHRR